MKNVLFSPVLKRNAKGQMFGNLGTVFGAFLLFVLATMPLKMALDYIPTQTLAGTVIYIIASIVVELWVVVLVLGISLFTLKLACHQDVAVLDIFYGLSSGLWIKAIALYAPAVIIFRIHFVLFNYAMKEFLALSEPLMKSMDMNSMMSMYSTGDVEELERLLLPVIPAELRFLTSGVLTLVVGVFLRVILFPALFILLDYPDKSVREIHRLSRKLVRGHFGKLLYIYLSFIPWYLLSLVTCYVSFGYSYPYMQVTLANAYLELARLTEEENKGWRTNGT